jgi:DNA helicase II / ATP-dependent DNA helicase PcrA
LKIYATGIGGIALQEKWITITKPENFRCSKSVRDLINKIRAPVDKLEQLPGGSAVPGKPIPITHTEGSARLFILPADNRRGTHIRAVREYLSRNVRDPLWLGDRFEADMRILVVVHSMAARRLGFHNLYIAFHRSGSKESFDEGTHWALQPFRVFILPVVKSFRAGDEFRVLRLLRRHSPLLNWPRVLEVQEPERFLTSLRSKVGRLVELMSPGSTATVHQVLKYVVDAGLFALEERLDQYVQSVDQLKPSSTLQSDPEEREEEDPDDKAGDLIDLVLNDYLSCLVPEVETYQSYIDKESPYSTQQGIKGAEFDRVLVVIDDEEGKRNTHFSYEKLFGLRELSKQDKANLRAGKETAIERTRRLLYVCCSRARMHLAVAFFTKDVSAAEKQLRQLGWFGNLFIHSADDLAALVTRLEM